jgi:hypothetical protein
MKINSYRWNWKKRKRLKKQIEIKRMRTKFKNKLKKLNDEEWNMKKNWMRNNQCK